MIQLEPDEYLELLAYKAMMEWLRANQQPLQPVVRKFRTATTSTTPAYEEVWITEGWAVGDGEPFETPEEAIDAAMRVN